MTDNFHLQRARSDFDSARKEAAMQRVVDRMLGRSSELFSFEEVKEKLGGIQGRSGIRREIPLKAVVGSVGRYNDFNRDFLPRAAHDRDRWVRVKVVMESAKALPPVEVYQVGEAFFVIDGNHRVSIARRRGDTHIMAYVTEIITRVGLSPDDSPEDLIRKSEIARFLEQTRLDKSAPETDFRVTEAGQLPLLLQQIEMVHFSESQKIGTDLPYEEAVHTWYQDYYLPVAEVIRDQNLLRHYPQRTETDLYVWLLDNKRALSDAFGWEVQLESVAAELAARQRSAKRVRRTVQRFLDPEHETGEWRSRHLADSRGKLFSDVVIWLRDEDLDGLPLQNALTIAAREDAHLLGLVIRGEACPSGAGWRTLQQDFEARCRQAGVGGQLSAGKGSEGDVLYARTRWADLAVLPRPEPGAAKAFHRMLAQIKIPVWIAGEHDPQNDRLLLAFDGSPKSHEALFLSAYLANLWGLEVSVVTAFESGSDRQTLSDARAYLETYKIDADYHESESPASGAILAVAEKTGAGLILTGSYHSHKLTHLFEQSTLDEVIAGANVPLLICR